MRGNLLLPHGLLFPISSKRSFMCTIPQRGLCNNSCGTLAGTRLSRYKLIKSFQLAARYLFYAPSLKQGSVTPALENWLVRDFPVISSLKKEGHFLFNDTLNTFYLRLYHVRHNPLSPHGLLFPISSKISFRCTIPKTGTLAGTRLSRL